MKSLIQKNNISAVFLFSFLKQNGTKLKSLWFEAMFNIRINTFTIFLLLSILIDQLPIVRMIVRK